MADPPKDATQQLIDLAGQGPPPAEATTSFAGVPKGYTTDTGIPAQYTTIDAARPGAWGRELISGLQDRMEALGLYTPGNEPSKTGLRGTWLPSDTAAYTQILFNANSAGISKEDALQNMLLTVASNPPATTATKRAPQVTLYTHPDDLTYIAQKTAQQVIGRNLSDDDLQKFIAGFHGMESTQSNATYAAGTPGGPGGAATAAPDMTAEATRFAEQMHPDEAYATKYIDAFKVFDQMINAVAPGARMTAAGGTTGV